MVIMPNGTEWLSCQMTLNGYHAKYHGMAIIPNGTEWLSYQMTLNGYHAK